MAKFYEDKGECISRLTWNESRKFNTCVSIGRIEEWLAGHPDVTASSKSAWATATIKFCDYVVDFARTNTGIPVPGTQEYLAYLDWNETIKKASTLATKFINATGPKRNAEAETNKRIDERIGNATMEMYRTAVSNMLDTPYFTEMCFKAQEVDLYYPDPAKFTLEFFNELGRMIVIILVLTNGQRPSAAGAVREDDINGIQPNLEDPRLMSMCVQEFEPDKDSKTSTEVRMSMDITLYNLILRYQSMRRVIITDSAAPATPDPSGGKHLQQPFFSNHQGTGFKARQLR